MRQRKPILFVAICAGLMLPSLAFAAVVSTPREVLAQYVIELQSAPEDQVLREQIIRLERTMTPSPAVPADANRFFVKATIFQQEATDINAADPLASSARDFAIFYYREALLIAPWWPEAYYGLSTSLEASGRSTEAAAALKLYAIAVKRDQGVVKP